MFLNIRWKLTLSFILLVSLVFSIAGFFLHDFLYLRLLQYTEGRMKKDTLTARDYIHAQGSDKLPEESDALSDQLGELLGMRVSIIRDDGIVLGDSMVPGENLKEVANHSDRPEFRQALSEGFGRNMRRSSTVHQHMLYMALPLDLKEKGIWVVRLALPLVEIDAAVREVERSLIKAGLLGLFIALIFGYATSLFITRRTLAIKKGAEAFARGDLRTRLPSMGKDELGALSQSLNGMAEKLNTTLEKLSSEKAELDAVLSSMVEGVLILDKERKIVSMNPALAAMLKPSLPPVGLTLMEVFRNAVLNDSAKKSIEELMNVEVEVAPSPHLAKICMVHFSPILIDKKAIGVVAVFNDISELKALINIRKEFVANVSHELKTPLTAIRGFAETLAYGAIDEEETRKKYLDGICRHVNRLGTLIDDILYLSRVESKRAEIKRERLDLFEEVDNAISTLREATRQRNIRILNEIEKNIFFVGADRKQLEQVFLNFLDNAIKYAGNGKGGEVRIKATPPQPVELEERGFPPNRTKDYLKITIGDNGPGIPPKDQPRIFERFYRVDKARSRDLGGTGLGLAIVKHIIEGHGGKVWVESEPGKGTAFHFLLPVYKEEKD